MTNGTKATTEEAGGRLESNRNEREGGEGGLLEVYAKEVEEERVVNPVGPNGSWLSHNSREVLT